MEPNEIVEMLHEEMYDADCSIDELEEIISSHEDSISIARMEIEFISGRKCLACSMLNVFTGDDE